MTLVMVTLLNGVTFSTQFGPGNYGDNYQESSFQALDSYESDEVEVAAWNKDGKWYDLDNREFMDSKDVKGYIKKEEWFEILDHLRTL